MPSGKQIVKAGDTLGINTEGADAGIPVIMRIRFKGKKITKDTVIDDDRTAMMSKWIFTDGICKERKGDGFVYLEPYRGGLFKKQPIVDVLAIINGYPISVSAPLRVNVRVPTEDPDSFGSVPVDGTIRLDAVLEIDDPKVLGIFLNNSYTEEEAVGEFLYTFVTAKGLSDQLSEQIQDMVSRAVSPNPYVANQLDQVEADILAKLNADQYMITRGVKFTSAALRLENTGVEAIDSKEARSQLEMRNMQIDKKIEELKLKHAAELRRYNC